MAMEDRKKPSSFSHSRMFSLAFPVQGYKSLFYMSICNSNPKEKYYILQSVNRLSLWGKNSEEREGKDGEREPAQQAQERTGTQGGDTRGDSPRVSPSLALVLSCAHYFQAHGTQAICPQPFSLFPSPQFPARPMACSQAIYTITLVSALLSPDHPALPPFQNKVYKKYL